VTPVLDVELIRSLRLAAGLSRRALADRLGASQTVIRGLKEGADHGSHPLDFLVQLAAALGTTPRALLLHEAGGDEASADDIKLEAALMNVGKEVRREAIARAFGWKLDRVTAAADRLGRRLTATGLMLQVHPGGRYAIRPRADVLKRFA
jgi:transcriptional regulator with XRE-family HTH domain